MIPKKSFSLLVAMFVCLGLLAIPLTVEAGPFGLFGSSGCSSGNCSSSSGYSAAETVVVPELASIAPHGVHWGIAESRAVRREQAIAANTPRPSGGSASNLVLAYRAGKIDLDKSSRTVSTRR